MILIYTTYIKRIVFLNSKAFTMYLAVCLLNSKTLINSFSLCVLNFSKFKFILLNHEFLKVAYTGHIKKMLLILY